jgi:hypothetical protein
MPVSPKNFKEYNRLYVLVLSRFDLVIIWLSTDSRTHARLEIQLGIGETVLDELEDYPTEALTGTISINMANIVDITASAKLLLLEKLTLIYLNIAFNS